MLLKLANPQLFARDYAYSDTLLTQHYTPLYLRLIEWLTGLTGSYARALLTLLPVITLTYLAGMFVLVRSITRNTWVAALLSYLRRSGNRLVQDWPDRG